MGHHDDFALRARGELLWRNSFESELQRFSGGFRVYALP